MKLSLVLALIGTSYLHDQVIGPKVRALKMKTVLTLTSQEQFLVRFSPLLGRLILLLGLAVLLAAVVLVRI